ncbi:hypothetical protein D3C80_1578970 [compost metagenome]
MQRLDGGVIAAHGQGLGIGKRQLQLAGQTVDTHGFVLRKQRRTGQQAPDKHSESAWGFDCRIDEDD